MLRISIMTATYNRGHLLHVPFGSLMNQNCKNFEWIIIDDGSTDKTEEVVKEFLKIADFPIRYFWQNNMGKAACWNKACELASTPYLIDLDSDDAFVEDAVTNIIDAWTIASQEDRFWCVVGQCIDEKGERVGGSWPKGINELTGRKQHKTIIQNKRGEKSSCRRVDILNKYPFPQFKDTKYISEDLIWEKINILYDQYCTNSVFRVYYYNPIDSLSYGKAYAYDRKLAYYHLEVFNVNERLSQITYNRDVRFSLFHVPRLAIYLKKPYSEVIKEIHGLVKKSVITVVWPMAMLFVKLYYKE